MRSLSRYQILHGQDIPPQQLRPFRAGPVTAMLDGIDLRYVRIGPVEVARRIYVAVRDSDWNTIPASYEIKQIAESEDGFSIDFYAKHDSPKIVFDWNGKIVGSRDGSIRYTMDGQGLSDFFYNRIGFCVLHPDRESAGKPYRAKSSVKGEFEGRFPDHIGIQGFENGFYVALNEPFYHLSMKLDPNLEVRFDFEGDLFETEDQRNWTDASFKTYCTPLSLGFPHRAASGDSKLQSVAMHVSSPKQQNLSDIRQSRQETVLTIGESLGRRMPPVGFGLPQSQ